MREIEEKQFQHDGEVYQIRVWETDDGGFVVRTFQNGQRVNPYSYSVDSDTSCMLKWDHNVDAFHHLMEIAEQDVRTGVWEQLHAAMSE